MNNLGARVTYVNQKAEQLLSSDSCNKDQIHQTRDQLNDRSEQNKADLNSRKYVSIYLFLVAFIIFCFLTIPQMEGV